jgi:hypothetical protein
VQGVDQALELVRGAATRHGTPGATRAGASEAQQCAFPFLHPAAADDLLAVNSLRRFSGSAAGAMRQECRRLENAYTIEEIGRRSARPTSATAASTTSRGVRMPPANEWIAALDDVAA